MDAEMTAPTAAAATATDIIEPKKWWRMMISPLPPTDVTAADRLQRLQNPWRRLLLPGEDRAPLQRRPLPCALPATARGDHSFLRRSEARYKVYSPGRSAW